MQTIVTYVFWDSVTHQSDIMGQNSCNYHSCRKSPVYNTTDAIFLYSIPNDPGWGILLN